MITMAKEFTKYSASSIGTGPTEVFTAITKTLLMGCNVSNITSFKIPFSVTVVNQQSSTTIVSGMEIDGHTSLELVKGKIVLGVGDKLIVKSSIENSIDIIVSVLEGV